MIHLHQALSELTPHIGTTLTLKTVKIALTNSVYKLDSARGIFALRLNNPYSAALGINRLKEQYILNSVQDQDWSIKPIAITDQYLLSQWYSSTHTATADNATYLFQLLQGADISMLSRDMVMDIKNQISTLLANTQLLTATFVEALQHRLEQYVLPNNLSLCHHDWHAGNIIANQNKITLIDWEYAAVGDNAIDLACLTAAHNLPSKSLNELLKKYGIKQHRFLRAQCLTEALDITWHAVRFKNRDFLDRQNQWLIKWS